MPVPDFHGLVPGHAAEVARTLNDLCARRDLDAWREWYDRFDEIRPMEFRSPKAPPITRRSMYTASPDLQRNVVPEPGSIDWVTSQYVRTRSPKHDIGMDAFNGTFLDGFNIESRLASSDHQRVFHAYRTRMLAPDARLEGDLAYLDNPDACCSHLDNDALGDLLAMDDEAGFTTALVAMLDEDPDSQGYGRAIERWASFLREVHRDGLDLFYMEFCS